MPDKIQDSFFLILMKLGEKPGKKSKKNSGKKSKKNSGKKSWKSLRKSLADSLGKILEMNPEKSLAKSQMSDYWKNFLFHIIFRLLLDNFFFHEKILIDWILQAFT